MTTHDDGRSPDWPELAIDIWESVLEDRPDLPTTDAIRLRLALDNLTAALVLESSDIALDRDRIAAVRAVIAARSAVAALVATLGRAGGRHGDPGVPAHNRKDPDQRVGRRRYADEGA